MRGLAHGIPEGTVASDGYPETPEAYVAPSYENLGPDLSRVELFTEFADHATNATGAFATLFAGNNVPLSQRAAHVSASVNAASRALGAVNLPLAPEVVTLEAVTDHWDSANVLLTCENVSTLTGHVSGVSISFQGDDQPGFSPHIPSRVTQGAATGIPIQDGQTVTMDVEIEESGQVVSSSVDVTSPGLEITIPSPPVVTHEQATVTVSLNDARYYEPAKEGSLQVQYKASDAVEWQGTVVVADPVTSLVVGPGLQENTAHDLRIRLMRDYASSYSLFQGAFATTELPKAVSNLQGSTDGGLRQVLLQWDVSDVVPAVTSFDVSMEYVSIGYPTSDSRTGVHSLPPASSGAGYSVTGLNYDSVVRFTVAARNSNGAGPSSSIVVSMPTTTVPPVPAAPTFSSHTEDSITLAYTHVVHDPPVASYNVTVVPPDAPEFSLSVTPVTPALITVSNLTSGADKLHQVSLSAVNKTGSSEFGPSLQVYTGDVTAPLLGLVEYEVTHESVVVTVTGAQDNSGGAVSLFAYLSSGSFSAASAAEAKAVVEDTGYSGGSDVGPTSTMTLTTFYDGQWAPAVPTVEYVLHVVAMDRVGNPRMAKFPGVAIRDTIPPVLTVSDVIAGNNQVVVQGSFSDLHSEPVTLSAVALSPPNGAFETAPSVTVVTDSPFAITLTQTWNGQETISMTSGLQGNVTLVATDGQGNTTRAVSDFHLPDTEPPTVTISSTSGNVHEVQYSVDASDDSGEPVSLQVFLVTSGNGDGVTPSSFSTTETGSLLQLGTDSSSPAATPLPPPLFQTSFLP